MRATAFIATLWLLCGPAVAAEPAPVLVELFTSQGCSSCPPADRLLGELAMRDDVVALAFHVTYWDRLGWPDTFGAPAWTDRQRTYAGRLGAGGLYTPQMVVAGRLDVVGSDLSRVLAAVDLAHEHAPASAITFADGRASLPPVTLDRPARLLLAAFTGRADVAIGRGENAGRMVAYHRIVRSLTDLGPWDGAARTLPLPALPPGADGFALFAQDLDTGSVVALGQNPTR
jgi:hypothetical protein